MKFTFGKTRAKSINQYMDYSEVIVAFRPGVLNIKLWLVYYKKKKYIDFKNKNF